ncbi:MAG: hypothetical protein IT181_19740, partial [Acidobacteria bacterium]|nr:hypothetical protein [Acidobacteriota bacterium]
PGEAFAPRTRYYGFQQILPYVQPGAVILPSALEGPERLSVLAVGGGEGRPDDVTLAAINRTGPVQLTVTLDGARLPPSFEVYVTNRDAQYEHWGRVSTRQGRFTLTVPARSVTTLSAGPPPDEEE